MDKSEEGLKALINTVPGTQGEAILARVRELIKSGNPAALALSLGYATEFYQQAAKLAADKMDKVPKALEGEQRSAFTIEDLSSDCYGSDIGYKIWKDAADSNTQIYDKVSQLFRDCMAVELTEDDKNKMMEETSPGSVNHIAGKDPRGTPVQDQNMDAPNLLTSAPAACKGATPLLCNLGTPTPAPGAPLPEVILNISGKEKTITAILPGGSKLKPSKDLRETTILKITADGKVTGVGKVNVPGIGILDFSMLTDLNFDELIKGEIPQVNLGMRGGDISMEGKMSISYDGLERMKKGPLAAEVQKFEAIFKSGKLSPIIKEFLDHKITADEFKDQLIQLVKDKYPEGLTAAAKNVLEEFIKDIIINTKMDFFGITSFSGIPVATTLFQKLAPVTILGNKAPVFRFAQGGLQIPFVLQSQVEKQFGLVAGYSEDWLIGDPRPEGAKLTGGFTAGLGLPQAELFLEGHASVATGSGFEMELGFHLSPFRLGSRETLKPVTPFDFTKVPQSILEKHESDRDKRAGPVSAYLKAGTRKLNVNLTYEMTPDGVQEVWLTLKGTHSIWDSK